MDELQPQRRAAEIRDQVNGGRFDQILAKWTRKCLNSLDLMETLAGTAVQWSLAFFCDLDCE